MKDLIQPCPPEQTGFVRNTPAPETKSFSTLSQEFQQRQGEFQETQTNFEFLFAGPILINLMSDLHVGHATTDYKRIDQETEAIVKTANSYVILAGDLIDNLWWNPGQLQEMEQTPKQIDYILSWMTHLASNRKLLHFIGGDHDQDWLMRAGYNLMSEFNRLGVSASQGPTYFDLDVGNTNYRMAGAHQLPGHSIYNTVHPEMRAVRFGSMHGADVVFAGHNHQKGYASAYQHELGEPQLTHYIALGPYKATDAYLQKKGWAPQKPEEMYGTAVYFDDRQKCVTIDLDIVRANKRFRG